MISGPKRGARGRPRGVGKPAGHAPALTAEQIEEMHDAYLEGWTVRALAARFGIALDTVQAKIDAVFRPAWRLRLAERFDEEVAKVDYLSRLAMEHFHKSAEPETRKQVFRELDDLQKKGKIPVRVVKSVKTTIKGRYDAGWLHVYQWCRDYFAKVGGYYQKDPLSDQVADVRPPLLLEVLVKDRDEARKMMDFQDFERLAREAKTKQMEAAE